jgi:acetylornithine aminotransferase/acetylornithine/N-succinyldiaminopimelate aminotransferase
MSELMQEVQLKLASIQAAEQKLMLQTYQRTPVLFVGGSGVHLRGEEGDEYLDLLSGIGVMALGYGHPAVEAAIVAQSKRLLHTSNLFYHEHTAELALRLTEMSGLDRVFFCNSGTEAWEAALKLARAHAGLLRAEGKKVGTRFLAVEQSFHGRTMGAVATTHKEKYRVPFEPVMGGVEFVRFDDVEDLRAKFHDAQAEPVCGICIEAVQGEGGVRPVSREFIAVAREMCDSTGALLLADEIQSGMGRTGEWFAYQHYGILPDITTVAKPMASGLPIGAMLCTDEAARAFTPGMHGSTFGGGPLVCAVAIAVIDTMKRTNLLAHVRDVGGYFKDRLEWLRKRHDCITSVRGMGLMLGIELDSEESAKRAAAAMLDQHIIVNRTSETVLRFLPPFILERMHIDRAIAALDGILTTLTLNSAALAGPAPAGEDSHEQ